MAINAAPDSVMVGGEVYNGPELGDYYVIVSDASLGETNNKERKQLILELTVKDDPGHPSMNGKKLTKMWQTFPCAKDDDRKRKVMFGGVGPGGGKTPREPIDLKALRAMIARIRRGKG